MVFAALMVVSLEARGVLDNMIAHALRDGAPNAVTASPNRILNL